MATTQQRGRGTRQPQRPRGYERRSSKVSAPRPLSATPAPQAPPPAPAYNHDSAAAEPQVSQTDKKDLSDLLAKTSSGAETEEKSGPQYNPDQAPPSPEQSSSKQRSWVRRQWKKLAIGGAIAAVLGTGGFYFASGPLEFVQLGQVLGKFGHNQQHSISGRIGDMMRSRRYIKSERVGETRVGFYGSRRVAAWEAKLANEAGITLTDRASTGRITGMDVELARNNQYGTGTVEQQLENFKAQLEKAGARAEVTLESRLEGRAHAEVTSADFANTERLIEWQNSKIERSPSLLGKFSEAINKRQLAKFWGIPRLYSPIKRLESKLSEKVNTFLDQRRETKLARALEENKVRESPTLKQRATELKTKISDAIAPHRLAASSALFITGAACIFKGIADDIVALNHSGIVGPASAESVSRQALGSQIQSGQDIDFAKLGDQKETLSDDKGNTVWNGKALNALANDNGGKGEDIETSYQQAFSNDTTGDHIKETLSLYGATDFACSKVGLTLQLIGQVALTVFTGGGNIPAKIIQFGRSTVWTMLAVQFVHKFLVEEIRESPIKSFAGPQGGDLLAYGARAAANVNARSMGGIELPGTEKVTVFKDVQEQDQKEFQRKSLWAQFFDMSDYRTVAAKVVRNTSPRPLENVGTATMALINPSRWSATIKSVFASKVQADEEPYDWEFPLYGLPPHIANDLKYEDPYENAEKAADLFNGPEGASLRDRAKKCFGGDIGKDADGRWDYTSQEDVFPANRDYISANCGDINDEKWVRTFLFVFDTSAINQVECYENNDEACGHFGLSQNSSTAAPSGAPGTWVWPVEGGGLIAACWGDIRSYYSEPNSGHSGLDIAAPRGRKALAAAAGVVEIAEVGHGYGHVVVIKHDNGYWTLYGHNYQFLVNVGDHVTAGQPVALIDNEGHSYGDHLHFNIQREPGVWGQTGNISFPDKTHTVNPLTHGLAIPPGVADRPGCMNFPNGGRGSSL